MSHLDNIERAEGWDLETIKKMCEREGWMFCEGQKTYKWFGQFVGDSPMPAGFTVDELGHCEHAIQVPGCGYEIGVVWKNGQWHLLYDYWHQGGLDSALGENAYNLTDAYDSAKSFVWAEENGLQAYEEKMPTGARQIHIKMGAGGGW